MPANPTQKKSKSWDGNVQDLPLVGKGASGLVFAIDKRRVAKVSLGTPRSKEDIEMERRIYERFNQMLSNNPSRYILLCLDTKQPRGLIFDRWDETVRARLQSMPSPPSIEDAKRWALQAAKGLAIVHDCGVIQGDGKNEGVRSRLSY
jgi:hypothetical protein